MRLSFPKNITNLAIPSAHDKHTQNTYCQPFMDELRRPVNRFPFAALHAIRDWVSSVVPGKSTIKLNPQQRLQEKVYTFG